jgi:outer membrane protein OmpA-like peptidoglycan-associated protein
VDATFTPDKGKLSDTDTTYSLFVGYQLVPWLAFEASWMDLGNETIKASGRYDYPSPHVSLDPDYGLYSADTKFESSGWALSAVPMLPLGESWNLFGRLGYYMGDNKISAAFSAQDYYAIDDSPVGDPYEAKDHNTDSSGTFMWGAGVSWTWNQQVTTRLEYTNVADVAETGGHKTDVERFTLGVAYRFGHVQEAAAPVAAAPVMAAPVAAPAPSKCADADNDGVCDNSDRCPNTPAGDRVDRSGCSCDVSIRTHFAFDSVELTAEDKVALDRVAARLQELHFVGGTAIGHTDSAGDEAYNQKLSERRAQAVVDYLAAKGVAPGRVTAVGAGETKPIADNSTEEGRAQNRRVTIRRTDCGPAD